MDIIRNGYGLPFTSIPQDCFIKNNKSALMHPKFVEDSIFKLLEDGCIQEVSSPARCVNPLPVAEGKKLRSVLDLRHVNRICTVRNLSTMIWLVYLRYLSRISGSLLGI